jgi:hypothetical protein
VNSSPCVSEIAHGIERSPWPASPCGFRRELTHGKSFAVCLGPFAVCLRHTAYDGFPVVPVVIIVTKVVCDQLVVKSRTRTQKSKSKLSNLEIWYSSKDSCRRMVKN